jgi:hypothetical protein
MPVIVCLFILSACHIVVPPLSVYDGMTPAGSQPNESPTPLYADVIKNKTVVLVTSKNFNNYRAKWKTYPFDKEETLNGGSRYKTYNFNNEETVDSAGNRIVQTTDPRKVSDIAYSTLMPYFKSVRTAANFDEAKSLKADYIVLIDYHTDFNSMGSRYMTKGGIYMLDNSLRRVLQAEGNADIDRNGHGGSDAVEEIKLLFAAGLDITTNQILAGIQAKMGSSPHKQIEASPQNTDDVKALIAKNDMQGLRVYLDEHPEALSTIKDSRLRLRYTGPAKLRIIDIEQLVKNKKKDAIIIAKVNSTSGLYKDFTDDEMTELQKMGISDEVVAAMIAATAAYNKEQKQVSAAQQVITQQYADPQQQVAEASTPADCLKLVVALKGCEQTGGLFAMGCKAMSRSQFNCPDVEKYMH